MPDVMIGSTPEWWEGHRVRLTIPMQNVWEDVKRQMPGIESLPGLFPTAMRVRKGELVIDLGRRFE